MKVETTLAMVVRRRRYELGLWAVGVMVPRVTLILVARPRDLGRRSSKCRLVVSTITKEVVAHCLVLFFSRTKLLTF